MLEFNVSYNKDVYALYDDVASLRLFMLLSLAIWVSLILMMAISYPSTGPKQITKIYHLNKYLIFKYAIPNGLCCAKMGVQLFS